MSQGSWQVPTGGVETAVTFAGQCNTAWLAVSSQNSGASAPANGPGSAPTQFQLWMDLSSALQPYFRIYDGANWDAMGRLDINNSIWQPQVGGGLGTISSAATTDLGNQPQCSLNITGTATINSFGSTPPNGTFKFCTVASQGMVITNGASILCPGGASITANAGDKFKARYEGAGVWSIWDYMSANAGAPGFSLPTGSVFARYGTGQIPGTVRCNNNTIGNTGSGATEGSGPAYFNLYSLIWAGAATDTEIVISGGVRGASASADWTALKTLTVPDVRNRFIGGLGTMGATGGASNRLTSTEFPLGADALGAIGGSRNIILVTSNLPASAPALTMDSYTPQGAITNSTTSTVHLTQGGNNDEGDKGSAPGISGGSLAFTGTAHILTGTIANLGSATAVTTVPPAKLFTIYMVL